MEELQFLSKFSSFFLQKSDLFFQFSSNLFYKLTFGVEKSIFFPFFCLILILLLTFILCHVIFRCNFPNFSIFFLHFRFFWLEFFYFHGCLFLIAKFVVFIEIFFDSIEILSICVKTIHFLSKLDIFNQKCSIPKKKSKNFI